MNQYLVTASNSNVPALKVLAHTVLGAQTKAEDVNARLFPGTTIRQYTIKRIKSNVR
jgi:hypothetical protein